MTEFKNGIFNTLIKLAGTSSVGRAVIYTVGHIFIAMVCNRVITGANWLLVGIDALIEPCINGVWYYFLDKFWISQNLNKNKVLRSKTVK
jgi:uncharacterized membrane protein